MVSILVCVPSGMAVVCAAADLPAQHVWPIPSTPSAYCESTAVVSHTVCCWVCGVWVVSVWCVLLVWWGILQ